MLHSITGPLLSVLFPQPCQACGGDVERHEFGPACGECWDQTRLLKSPLIFCVKCGCILPAQLSPQHTDCSRCRESFFDGARSVGFYEAALSAVVISMKTKPFMPALARQLLVDAFASSPFTDADVIIPVPLSNRRRFERGFNQAEVIAAIVGKAGGIPVDNASLLRTLHTPIHRALMDNKARDMSVRKAFQIGRPRLITQKKVLLVDDVFTSGSTANHCARLLKKSGAAAVNVLTLARAQNR